MTVLLIIAAVLYALGYAAAVACGVVAVVLIDDSRSAIPFVLLWALAWPVWLVAFLTEARRA